MTQDQLPTEDTAIATAITELKALILQRFPDACFSVVYREDAPGTRLRVIIDGADVQSDDVLDVVVDKLFEVQVEQGLPVYVIPIQPLSRLPEQIRNASVRHSAIDLDISILTG
ncbi:MAG TPA: hypothetical protein VKU87_06730 [Thermomicrobiaceae bacterium]|nr:hypothetical protein [Thermomicrobiaceae bacterium]